MKQFEAHEAKIGGYKFYIFPFTAFKAANLSAELTALLSPLVPVISSISGNSILDLDVDKFVCAMKGLTGDKLEDLLKKLLIQNKNITYENEESGEAEPLTEGVINKIFCCEFENLLLLAFEVIKLNYGSFFRSIGLRYGSAGDQQDQTKT